jgi:hypothetical protein
VSYINKYADRPVVIGGIGGSGTRLIAQILNKLGFYIGRDINQAFDNLWFTLLFKRKEVLSLEDREFSELLDIFLRAMTGKAAFNEFEVKAVEKLALEDRKQHPSLWLQNRAHSLLTVPNSSQKIDLWGWKEPNSHIVLDRLQKNLPAMKYIHVMRNGLDMAFSANQNQLAFWGNHFIGSEFQISPYYSLKYWCIMHRRILDLGSTLKSGFFLLNYDKFCTSPEENLKKLLVFLELDIAKYLFEELLNIINIPDSIGRFRQNALDELDIHDIEFVRSLGFDTQ